MFVMRLCCMVIQLRVGRQFRNMPPIRLNNGELIIMLMALTGDTKIYDAMWPIHNFPRRKRPRNKGTNPTRIPPIPKMFVTLSNVGML